LPGPIRFACHPCKRATADCAINANAMTRMPDGIRKFLPLPTWHRMRRPDRRVGADLIMSFDAP